jgi:hypothetical protein
MDKTAGARRRPILWIEQVDHILRMATTPPPSCRYRSRQHAFQ